MSSPLGTTVLRSTQVAVWGTGAEGRSVAALALRLGAEVMFVRDGDLASPELVGDRSVPVVGPDLLSSADVEVVVVSPGVSRYRPELAAARRRGAIVTSATALWLADHADRRVIGVTGTKGKSTTAWLTFLLLEETGRRVVLGGNIGTPVTELPDDGVDVYVLEVSSYQSAEVQCSPAVGVLTLLAPDHLDWHGGYERYVADKLNLFRHRPDLALAVNGQSSDAVRATADFAGRRRYELDGQRLVVDGEALCDLPDGLRGEHNRLNLAGAATAVLLETGEAPTAQALASAVARMPVLPSRLETVGWAGGVEFVDDALASNPSGTVAAVRAMGDRPLALVVGGRDRAVDTSELVTEIMAADPPSAVVGLGDFGARLVAELRTSGHGGQLETATTIGDAVSKAVAHLGGAGVVLFSPAAPTPPEEGTYQDRREGFARAVLSLGGRRDRP